MGERRESAEDGSVADEHVEAPEALIKRGTERIDGLAVGEVEWNEARNASDRANVIVNPPEIGHAAGEQQHMRTFPGVGESNGSAKPARSAGDERDTALETLTGQPTSARKESCFCCGGPSRSLSRVGYSPVKQ